MVISQTRDFHFANYGFSFRFALFRFANYSKPKLTQTLETRSKKHFVALAAFFPRQNSLPVSILVDVTKRIRCLVVLTDDLLRNGLDLNIGHCYPSNTFYIFLYFQLLTRCTKTGALSHWGSDCGVLCRHRRLVWQV